jgi:hypothetical protein
MRKLVLIISLIFASGIIFGQTETLKKYKGEKYKRNSFYLEILGNSLPATVNFEHIWTKWGGFNIGTTVGGSYFPINDKKLANGTFEVNLLCGRSKHMFEFSIGRTYAYFNYYPEVDLKKEYHIWNSTVRLGYRYQKPTGGLFFRTGIVSNTSEAIISNDMVESLAFLAAFHNRKISYILPYISIGFCI